MNICENSKDCYYKQKTADLLRQVDFAFSEVQFQKRRYARLKKALHTKNNYERIAGARKFAEKVKAHAERCCERGIAKIVCAEVDNMFKEYKKWQNKK